MRFAIGFGCLVLVACTASVPMQKTSLAQRYADACAELASICNTTGNCQPQMTFCADPQRSQALFAVEDACKTSCSYDTPCLRSCKMQRVSAMGDTSGACSTLLQTCATSGQGCTSGEFLCMAQQVPSSPCATQFDECKSACAPHDHTCTQQCRAAYRQCQAGTSMPDAGVPDAPAPDAPPMTTTTYDLTYKTSGTGTGTIALNPAGTSCGTACAAYTSGTMVTLTATASSGSTFTSWTGCTSTTNICTVTMTQALTVTATFTAAVTAVSLKNDVQPIFTLHCAGCHSGGTAPNLSSGKSYTELVNVTAGSCSSAKYVVPSQPTQSYLITVLTSGSTLGACNGGSMAGFLSSSTDLKTITTWISQGALNN